jgi:hypothetical protein
MSGDGPVTIEDLANASRSAQAAREHAPSLPFGAAADCDIARRLGDERMLRTCTDQLTALAPDHYETRRARAAFEASSADRFRLAFWLAFLLGGLATLAHAMTP